MKHIIKLLICLFIAVGCQSQSSKDREEMQRLIDDKKRLESDLSDLKWKRNDEYFKSFKMNDFSSDEETDSIVLALSVKYPRIPKITDSLFKINNRINELRLLMGK